MPRPLLEVADVFRAYGDVYRQEYGASMSREQCRVMHAIEVCRTAALGGHVDECDHCGHQAISYNSCRNRHCPKCQSLDKAQWLEARQAEILSVAYHHAVFTLPEALAPVALQNQTVVYNILFRAASQTLLTIASDPKHLGAEIGFTAILHTWGQNLLHHPHLHCVIPAGGLSPDRKRWVRCRPGFFLPVRVLSRLYRRLFLEALTTAFSNGQLGFHGRLEPLAAPHAFARLVQTCQKLEWVVYSKPPFGGPQKVLDYLGRYTHRVAIANHRLLRMQDGQVTFTWKDYKHQGRQQTMTLDATEFIRRFLLHVLPKHFVRIRYYGLLANCHRSQNIQRCRQLLGVSPATTTSIPETHDWVHLLMALTGRDPLLCPVCKQGHLVRIHTLGLSLPPREKAPPKDRPP